MNYGHYQNCNLFASDEWIVVKELELVTYFHRSTGTINYLFEGMNVLSISLQGDRVYFVGEGYFGGSIFGAVNLNSTNEDSATSINDLKYIEAF
ncbi:hypothetical protein [Photobacterium lutimaris]|uniref:Uncharacterized protein n=1 Tax=Photobacterium lutimaris TaxID=388278 RepID=A0A2T3IQ47_9GAMM|nr:hypothetical protein [Photobacterium lutimaris]PSU30468.1 hypothetical protein C9I99_23115 [Photobacterium lutimaris]TDR76021.1 hypothetical protein DFP78_1036 [Photobacterium lutimaris]